MFLLKGVMALHRYWIWTCLQVLVGLIVPCPSCAMCQLSCNGQVAVNEAKLGSLEDLLQSVVLMSGMIEWLPYWSILLDAFKLLIF